MLVRNIVLILVAAVGIVALGASAACVDAAVNDTDESPCRPSVYFLRPENECPQIVADGDVADGQLLEPGNLYDADIGPLGTVLQFRIPADTEPAQFKIASLHAAGYRHGQVTIDESASGSQLCLGLLGDARAGTARDNDRATVVCFAHPFECGREIRGDNPDRVTRLFDEIAESAGWRCTLISIGVPTPAARD